MSDRIISWLPDYLFFIGIFVVVLIIYKYLPDDFKEGTKKFLGRFWIYIIIGILWWYYRGKLGLVAEHPDWIPANFAVATFWALFMLFLVWMGKFILYEERYSTDHFIANNLKGSCARRQDIGNWTIFFLGTSGSSDERFVIPWPTPQKIAVVPIDSWRYIGNQISSTTQVVKTELIKLPEEVRNFIENDSQAMKAKENIYFGIFSSEAKTRDPTKQEVEDENKKLNARVGKLSKMLDGQLREMKGFVSDTMAIVDKVKGKSIFKPQSTRSLEE